MVGGRRRAGRMPCDGDRCWPLTPGTISLPLTGQRPGRRSPALSRTQAPGRSQPGSSAGAADVENRDLTTGLGL